MTLVPPYDVRTTKPKRHSDRSRGSRNEEKRETRAPEYLFVHIAPEDWETDSPPTLPGVPRLAQ